MIFLIGVFVVIVSIASGYILEGGTFKVLFQPAELIIIGGAALGSLLIGSTRTVLGLLVSNFSMIVSPRHHGRPEYVELLSLLNQLLNKIRREGLASIEKDIENPEQSAIFSGHPRVRDDEGVVRFICDTFRVFLVTGDPVELDNLMSMDMQNRSQVDNMPAYNLAKTAEALPGLGIVAAVLGVVLTMGKISQPPEVLGHSIGAALVGTFLGVLLCYGFVGPMATKLENQAHERDMFFTVIRAVIMSTASGATPMIALEYGRRSVPEPYRPSFQELDDLRRGR
jgi:chemotaxis protein MotA